MSETAASLTARKRALRAELQERLGGLSRARLRAASRAAAARLASTPWWREAQWVFAYMAMQAELQTRAIIRRALREGKAVAVPRIEGGEISFYTYEGRGLSPNRFGILEPDPRGQQVSPERLQGRALLILAPGLGFDRKRQRLGRGKGYYDRYLARVRSAGVAARVIGLAFTEQLVEVVPVGSHDQPLDGVVTDREVIGLVD